MKIYEKYYDFYFNVQNRIYASLDFQTFRDKETWKADKFRNEYMKVAIQLLDIKGYYLVDIICKGYQAWKSLEYLNILTNPLRIVIVFFCLKFGLLLFSIG